MVKSRERTLSFSIRASRLVSRVTLRVERLWSGARWAEGPAWFAAGRYLVWSDIPNNRMMRFIEPSGEVSVFREPANNSNGNTVGQPGTARHLRASHAPRDPHRD